MDHDWLLLPQDRKFRYVKDYQCKNCGWYKAIHPPNSPWYSNKGSRYTTDKMIRPCSELIMESVLV